MSEEKKNNGEIEKKIHDELLSDEAKRGNFKLFELANYSGIAIGLMGAVILELILILPDKTIPEKLTKIMLLCATFGVGLIAFFTVRHLAKKTIGMVDDAGLNIPYIAKIKDDCDNFKKIRENILKSEFMISKDSIYKYDKEEKGEWSKKKKEGTLWFKNTKSKSVDIELTISKNNFRVVRPTTKEGKEFENDLTKFVNKLKDEKVIESVQSSYKFNPETEL
ncbi:hypothetical protein KY348_01755 [Candidatus Woesearchaeota archaeon]|nr:hypothetical protein [Candidatus Woesearchaeota archaeon]